MRFIIGFPFLDEGPESGGLEAHITLARAVEAAGLDAVRATDHPFPVIDESKTGHHTFDPFLLLCCVARETTTLGLHFHVLVLPYRNPFVVANAVNTLDHASGGDRVVLGVAGGYLAPEFAALGVDRANRGRLVEDGIQAMKQAWTGEPVYANTPEWTAAGNTLLPRPLTSPHPPIWMGGNSDVVIERAVRYCDGWVPSGQSAERVRYTGSVSLGSFDLLRERIKVLHETCERLGRETPPEICMVNPPGTEWSTDPTDRRALEGIEELEAMGVSAVSFRFTGKALSELLEKIAAWGELVRQAPVNASRV